MNLWLRPSNKCWWLPAAAAAAALVPACAADRTSTAAADAHGARPAASTRSAAPIEVPSAARNFRSTRDVASVALPVGVVIPKIGVSASVERLGRNADDTVEVPRHAKNVGWYVDGPRPGQPGSAVILGHVDSIHGPAVFYRLRTLRRGDPIVVRRADRSAVTFVVDRVGEYPKAHFPAVEVYWPTLAAELRLVTCGGAYLRSANGYQSNVIVFAHLLS